MLYVWKIRLAIEFASGKLQFDAKMMFSTCMKLYDYTIKILERNRDMNITMTLWDK